MPLKTKPAKGVKGYIIRSAVEPGYLFRVYDGNKDFTDYEIGRAHV